MARCAQCAEEFSPKRTNSRCCSKRCSKRLGRDSSSRQCGAEGCVRPVRAKDLCSTHYNQRDSGRYPAKVVTRCARCGVSCEKRPDPRRPRQHCSLKCRTDDQWESARAARVARDLDREARKLPVLRDRRDPRSTLRWKAAAAKLGDAPRRVDWWQFFIAGSCVCCGTYFVSPAAHLDKAALYCSPACAKRIGKDRYRARKRSAFVESFGPVEIFERDRWTCKLCGRRVKRSAKPPDPKAPVVDHIVPLAAGPENGGVHARWNAQCAHFLCNSTKSARLEQPALF